MAKISIIIPVYNTEQYLRKCLDSVINQTCHIFEVICINDGSTDKSLEILKEYEKKYKFFKLYTQENKGLGATWNLGIGYASGDYISFVDSDDYIEPNLIEEVNKIINTNKNLDIIRFKGSAFDDITGKEIEHPFINMTYFPKELFNKIISIDTLIEHKLVLPVNSWLGLCRRDFIIKNHIKFDNLKCSNDVSFFYWTLAKAQSIYISDKTLINYRKDRSNNLTSRRAENFICDIHTFETIKKFTENLPIKQKEYLLRADLIHHILYWFKNSFFTKYGKKNYKMLHKFLKDFSIKNLDLKFDYFSNRKTYYYYFFLNSIKHMPFYLFYITVILYKKYLYVKTHIQKCLKQKNTR